MSGPDLRAEPCFRALRAYHRALPQLKPGMARGLVRLVLLKETWEPARRRLAMIVARHPPIRRDPKDAPTDPRPD